MNPHSLSAGIQSVPFSSLNSIQYLSNRIAELEKVSQLQKQRIIQLQKQNQQLMGIVVQASHHNVNKTNQFIQKIQKLVHKRLAQSTNNSNNNYLNTNKTDKSNIDNSDIKQNISQNHYTIRIKTENNELKNQKSKSKSKSKSRQAFKNTERQTKRKQSLKHKQNEYLQKQWKNKSLHIGKQNDNINVKTLYNKSNVYQKLNKRQLFNQMQSLKRIQKKLL